MDSREWSIHRSSQGNGARRTPQGAATGIAAVTESPLVANQRRRLRLLRDRARRVEPSREPHPARAALAYLARSRTMATNAELATLLKLSRPESVPNLTRRFAAWLASDGKVRKQLRGLEEDLDESGYSI